MMTTRTLADAAHRALLSLAAMLAPWRTPPPAEPEPSGPVLPTLEQAAAEPLHYVADPNEVGAPRSVCDVRPVWYTTRRAHFHEQAANGRACEGCRAWVAANKEVRP
jgi:hypothetical protein